MVYKNNMRESFYYFYIIYYLQNLSNSSMHILTKLTWESTLMAFHELRKN